MSRLDNGGAAFPGNSLSDMGSTEGPNPGMDLRDWFAGQALAGICAHEDTWGLQLRHIGPKAYEIADAMIAARQGDAA